jgi:hypothetical protein
MSNPGRGVIDAIGVTDGVEVGKGIGVLVEIGVGVTVKTRVGDCVLVGCVSIEVRLEEHPSNAIRKVTDMNSLNFIFYLFLIDVGPQSFSNFTLDLHPAIFKIK